MTRIYIETIIRAMYSHENTQNLILFPFYRPKPPVTDWWVPGVKSPGRGKLPVMAENHSQTESWERLLVMSLESTSDVTQTASCPIWPSTLQKLGKLRR